VLGVAWTFNPFFEPVVQGLDDWAALTGPGGAPDKAWLGEISDEMARA